MILARAAGLQATALTVDSPSKDWAARATHRPKAQ